MTWGRSTARQVGLLSLVFPIPTLFAVPATADSARSAHREIRWEVISDLPQSLGHVPIAFSKALLSASNGGMELAPVQSSASMSQAARDVEAGKAELTLIDNSVLGRNIRELWLLELPYLFKDPEDASRTLNGDVGHQLLSHLRWEGLVGLCFIDGGFRVVAARRELRDPNDFRELRIRVRNTPVTKTFFRKLHVDPVPDLSFAGLPVETAGIDGVETTPAIWADEHHVEFPVLNVTQHSLWVLSIVANEKFFESLSRAEQEALIRSARQVATEERVRLAQKTDRVLRLASAKGERVIYLSEREHSRFAERSKAVYPAFPRLRVWVDRIRGTARQVPFAAPEDD